MKKYLFRLIATTLAMLAAGEIIPGIVFEGFGAALIAAFLLGIVNTIIRPILVFITFPFTLVTFGIFLLVINALMLLLVSGLVDGFFVVSFGSAVLGSIFISIISWLVNRMTEEKKRDR